MNKADDRICNLSNSNKGIDIFTWICTENNDGGKSEFERQINKQKLIGCDNFAKNYSQRLLKPRTKLNKTKQYNKMWETNKMRKWR